MSNGLVSTCEAVLLTVEVRPKEFETAREFEEEEALNGYAAIGEGSE